MDGAVELYTKLKSFKVREGLSRMDGNADLYIRILKSYATSFKDTVKRMNQYGNAGKIPDLLQELHALKGTAANLESTEVHRLAVSLEQGVKAGKDILTLDEFKKLKTALAISFQEINSLSGADKNEAPGSLPMDRLKKKLSALKVRLADYDVDAMDILGEIRDSLCEMGYEKEVMELEEKTSIYDFDGALAQFAKMEQQIKQ
nr:Hpt domain-containing protein [Desulfobacula sp.]